MIATHPRFRTAPAPADLSGLELTDSTLEAAVDHLAGAVGARAPLRVTFINADCVNIAAHHAGYRDALRRASLRFADGIGVRIAARLRGHRLLGNVNGTDLFPLLMARLNTMGARIFLLGAEPGVAESVADELSRNYPELRVVGVRHGFFTQEESPALIAEIRSARPDLLLTALGAPRQELLNDALHAATGVPVVMGVGGLFNFVSGRISRAPSWMRRAGLEWVHRLAMEPRRMWRRYLVGNVRFLVREVGCSARLGRAA